MSDFQFQITRDGAHGEIARIDLNRPDEGNALTRAMMLQLSATLRELGRQPDVQRV